ncbi:MAG: hypothetical protein APR54_00070 [Candidatus Cloacimonas sp. SDB]|nr:MAG: hypothetical protein APR54_00070 [Candidatus Cloacimonas sp. SDB]
MKKYSYYGISILVILIDQISKIIVRTSIAPNQTIKVTDKFFWLTNVQNPGVAFSFLSGESFLIKYLLVFISIVAIIILSYLILKSTPKLEKIVFALILGGAAGNLIDRIIFGKVTDLIWVDFPDFIMQRWPVFNLADSSIVIAVILILIHTIFFANKNAEV